jgi:2-polyprenyl-3-methyl-5-hydroxy-6-metoxy-1,4-benzoquinol methylase
MTKIIKNRYGYINTFVKEEDKMQKTSVQPEGNYYDKYGSSNIIIKKIMNNFFKNISILITSIKYNNVFDVGCGEGYVTNYISKLSTNIKIEGIDISERVIEKARDSFPHIDFSVGSILSIDQPSNSYDLVVACEVLEHLEDPKLALQEVFRISSKYVFISVPNEPIWRISNFLRGKYITNWGNTPGHIQHWSKKDIISLVQNYGRVIKVCNPFPWTMLIAEKESK